MKEPDEQSLDQDAMVGHRLPPPSPELRDRVLGAARSAWAEAPPEPAEIPWILPVLRLAASVAIAWIAFQVADALGRQSLARWQAPEPSPAPSPSHLAFPKGSFASGYSFVENAPEALIERRRLVEEVLREAAGGNG